MPDTPVSIDHPLMQAWRAYQATDEYANTARWAPTHTAGSLWAAFEQGWRAAVENLGGPHEPTTVVTDQL